MVQYMIRLDDACPTMNHDNWKKMEVLLDRYEVKPIVGVIPDNKDPDFYWEDNPDFYTQVSGWQSKGWTIALHGRNHVLHTYIHTRKNYYQKSHSVHTEFAGVDLEKQKEMIDEGVKSLREHGIETNIFFAPAHTYDKNTVKACLDSGVIKFISDGYSLKPFKRDGMIFIPSICDGPFNIKIPGVYTFVCHPSAMEEKQFERIRDFLDKNKKRMTNVYEVMENQNVQEGQGIIGHLIELAVYFCRGVRKWTK